MSATERGAGVALGEATPSEALPTVATVPGQPTARHVRSEFLYFALRNWKFVLGAAVVLSFLGLALIGPLLTDHTPLEFTGPTDQRPSSEYWFGTTSFGQDVFAQFVHGLRAAFAEVEKIQRDRGA